MMNQVAIRMIEPKACFQACTLENATWNTQSINNKLKIPRPHGA